MSKYSRASTCKRTPLTPARHGEARGSPCARCRAITSSVQRIRGQIRQGAREFNPFEISSLQVCQPAEGVDTPQPDGLNAAEITNRPTRARTGQVRPDGWWNDSSETTSHRRVIQRDARGLGPQPSLAITAFVKLEKFRKVGPPEAPKTAMGRFLT